jgi:hypothetical protein
MIVSGKYHVKAFYRNDTTRLVSDTASFEVIMPPPEEQNAYTEIRNIFREQYVKKASDAYIVSFKGFLAHHPQSVFVPLAKIYLASSYDQLGNRALSDSVRLQVIRDHPQTCYALEALAGLRLTPEKKQSYLLELRKTNPESRLGKCAERLLSVPQNAIKK